MNIRQSLLLNSIVKPFYRENAGLLCFVYYIMFLAVGQANGIDPIEYHYSLIRGMLNQASFMVFVIAIWLCYTLKCMQFVSRSLQRPEFSYLFLLSQLSTRKIYLLFLQVSVILLLPVLTYVVVILCVGYHEHWYSASTFVLMYNLVICLSAPWVCVFLIRRPGQIPFTFHWKLPRLFDRKYYVGFLLRFVTHEGKMMFILTKIFSCGVLYFFLDERDPAREPDMRMITLFYCFGLFGHGILIHRMKQIENTGLAFYRTLPISLVQRFIGYCVFYACLFVPEILTVIARTPAFLTFSEAGFFLVMGFSVLMLLNALQLFNYSGIRDYFKTLMQFFIIFLLSLISRTEFIFSILTLLLAVTLFFTRYYRFEPEPDNVLK